MSLKMLAEILWERNFDGAALPRSPVVHQLRVKSVTVSIMPYACLAYVLKLVFSRLDLRAWTRMLGHIRKTEPNIINARRQMQDARKTRGKGIEQVQVERERERDKQKNDQEDSNGYFAKKCSWERGRVST